MCGARGNKWRKGHNRMENNHKQGNYAAQRGKFGDVRRFDYGNIDYRNTKQYSLSAQEQAINYGTNAVGFGTTHVFLIKKCMFWYQKSSFLYSIPYLITSLNT